MWPPSGHSIYAEHCEALISFGFIFLEVVSLLVVAVMAVSVNSTFSLFIDSKIQIQRRNRCAITMGYEAKSEEMGGIGEKLGGVA